MNATPQMSGLRPKRMRGYDGEYCTILNGEGAAKYDCTARPRDPFECRPARGKRGRKRGGIRRHR